MTLSPPRRQLRLPAAASQGRSLLTTLAVGLSLTLLIIAGCTEREKSPIDSVQETINKSTIATRDTLRVGVYQDAPLMGYLDEAGRRSGFEIDLARGIAKFLGFDEDRITWVSLTTPQRETALQRGDVDLVVASFSITEERRKKVRFAGPYLVTEQKVLIPAALDGEIAEIRHLRDSELRVCVTGASTTKDQLIKEGIKVETVSKREDCVAGLLDGTYVAMSSDETILAGFKSQRPAELSIVNMPFGASESLGIGIPLHDKALQDVVGHYLMRNYREEQAAKKEKDPSGRRTDWEIAYARNLGTWLEDVDQPFPVDVPELRDHDDRGREDGAAK